MTPNEALARMIRLREMVADPRAFYLNRRDEWEAMAARITVETLRALRPEEVDARMWELACASSGRRVAAELLNGEVIGLRIGLGDELGGELDDPNRFTIDGIRVEDVERWVEMTRNRELPADVEKHLGKIDDANTNLQVAWRIIYAIKNNRKGVAERLKFHIKKFLGWDVQEQVAALYPEVLKAWLDYFEPMAARDWEEWLEAAVVASGLR